MTNTDKRFLEHKLHVISDSALEIGKLAAAGARDFSDPADFELLIMANVKQIDDRLRSLGMEFDLPKLLAPAPWRATDGGS